MLSSPPQSGPMLRFTYKAIAPDGRVIRDTTAAASAEELESRLLRMGLEPLILKQAGVLSHWFSCKVPVREKTHFCFHLEQLLSAGVPVIDALNELHKATHHPRMANALGTLVERLNSGCTLSEAMAEQADIFDPVFCSLIQAGERCGNLSAVLKHLIAALTREAELASTLRKLCLYPAFVVLTTAAVVLVTMLYVIPELSALFRTAGMSLPWQTRALIWLSAAIGHFWLPLVTMAGLTTCALPFALHHPGMRMKWDALKLRLPLTGEVYRKIILARFCSLFALMYASGISILDALASTRSSTGNRVLEQALQDVTGRIQHGQAVSAAFADASLFPSFVVRMLQVGEQTGRLDEALGNVSNFYERDVNEAVGRMQSVIEPLLTLLLGALMLWVASAMLGPIYDLVSQMAI